MDLAAGTKTSTLNQSVSGRFFARCRRHFLVAFQSERFPLASASRCAISKSLGTCGRLDWAIFISPRLVTVYSRTRLADIYIPVAATARQLVGNCLRLALIRSSKNKGERWLFVSGIDSDLQKQRRTMFVGQQY